MIVGVCFIGATLTVTTVELDGTSRACLSGPSRRRPRDRSAGHRRRATSLTCGRRTPLGLLSKDGASQSQSVLVVGDSTACTMLIGLKAVGPSYGMPFENGAVIGCGIVSGVIAPYYVNGHNIVAYTSLCQGQANQAESQAIERYHPSLILWASTDERSSIVVNATHGSKVLSSGSPEWRSVMLQRMDTRINKFLATGAKVVLTLAPPEVHTLGYTDAELLTPAAHLPGRVKASQDNADDADYAHVNSLLKRGRGEAPAQGHRCGPLIPSVPLGHALSVRRAGLQSEADLGRPRQSSQTEPTTSPTEHSGLAR